MIKKLLIFGKAIYILVAILFKQKPFLILSGEKNGDLRYIGSQNELTIRHWIEHLDCMGNVEKFKLSNPKYIDKYYDKYYKCFK